MNPLRSLDLEKLKAAGYGTERPLSDHPEVLRNMLLRGGHDDWCHVIIRTQNEPEFRKILKKVLQTIPYPPAWEYPGSDDPEGDPDVESAARPIFQRLLEKIEKSSA